MGQSPVVEGFAFEAGARRDAHSRRKDDTRLLLEEHWRILIAYFFMRSESERDGAGKCGKLFFRIDS